MVVRVVAVTVVGLLGIVNPVFSSGGIRRWRAHTEILSQLGSAPGRAMVRVGASVGEFSAATVDGALISRQGLRAEMVESLEGAATVVLEPRGGPVATACDVRACPAFGLPDADGVARASGLTPAASTAIAPA